MRPLVAIPVYNHARTLRRVVEGVLATGLPAVVVDDGSTDAPLAAVSDLPVATLRLEQNQGKGAALLAAATWAAERGHEALVTLDADGQHDPGDLPRILAAAAADWPCLVVGVRRMDGPAVPFSSRFGRRFSNFWIGLETGTWLADTQSGFRLYPVAALTGPRYWSRRFTFEAEVLVRAVWAGFPVREVSVGVDYAPEGGRVSHFHKLRDNVRLTVLHTALLVQRLFR